MQNTQQEFKAGDVLKCIAGYSQDHHVMFLKKSNKRPHHFHGVVVVGSSSTPIGFFSKRFGVDCFELAASATPAPSGLWEAANALLDARNKTEMTHEDSYLFLFKSAGKDFWNALDDAVTRAPAPSGKLEEAVDALRKVAGMSNEDANSVQKAIITARAFFFISLANADEASESALPENSEVKELPKWCIKITYDNATMLSGWGRKQCGTAWVASKAVDGFVHSNGLLDADALPGYPIIDDATFKAQVLKQPINS